MFEKLRWKLFPVNNREKMENYIIEFVNKLKTLCDGIQEDILHLAIVNGVRHYVTGTEGAHYLNSAGNDSHGIVDETFNLCQYVYKKGKWCRLVKSKLNQISVINIPMCMFKEKGNQ